MPNEYFSFSELQGAFMPTPSGHVNIPTAGHIGIGLINNQRINTPSGHVNIPTAGHIGIGLINNQHINTPSGHVNIPTAGQILWDNNTPSGNTNPKSTVINQNNSIQASQFIKHHLRRNNKAHIISGFIGADSAGRPY